MDKYLNKTYIKKEILKRLTDGKFPRLWEPVERWHFTLELDKKGKFIQRLSSGAGHNKFSLKQVENNVKRGKWVEVTGGIEGK